MRNQEWRRAQRPTSAAASARARWIAAGSVAGLALLAGSAWALRRAEGQSSDSKMTARVRKSVTIHRSRQEIYDFWRDFRNLPQFMENLVSIADLPDGVTRWTVKGPGGTFVNVDSEILADQPGDRIQWRTIEGSEIHGEGTVEFRDAPGDRGTIVTARIAYDPPAGEVGRFIAKWSGREPEIQTYRELKRLKMLLETGEIATAQNRRNTVEAEA